MHFLKFGSSSNILTSQIRLLNGGKLNNTGKLTSMYIDHWHWHCTMQCSILYTVMSWWWCTVHNDNIYNINWCPHRWVPGDDRDLHPSWPGIWIEYVTWIKSMAYEPCMCEHGEEEDSHSFCPSGSCSKHHSLVPVPPILARRWVWNVSGFVEEIHQA